MEAQQGVWGNADIPWPSGVCQLAVTHGDEMLYVVFSLLDVLTLGFFYIKKIVPSAWECLRFFLTRFKVTEDVKRMAFISCWEIS